MMRLTDKDLIRLAIQSGMISEQQTAEPINRTGDDTQTRELPAYEAGDEERHKHRQTLVRRLRKLLRQRGERLARLELRNAMREALAEALKDERNAMMS